MNTEALERALGYAFSDRRTLQQALTHRSFGSSHNERIEFLGDSVLNCVIARALYRRFGQSKEGELSRLRAQLVRQEALHRLAESVALGDFLRLGEGELKSGGHRRPSILADALEAVFGAVFLDGGYDEASRVIETLYGPLLDGIDPAAAEKDAKTSLQEWLQSRRYDLPSYSLRSTRGAAHSQEFEVECAIPSLGVVTTGTGSNRRGAEQEAARRAFELLKK